MTDVTREQMSTLEQIVELTQSLEESIGRMQAARDGALALASRWAMGAAGDADEADISLRSVSAELGSALRVSDRTVQRRMAGAELLVERFPAVWAAQGAGQISAGHSRVIVDAGAHIADPAAREAYALRVLEFAREECPNRVRPLAERLAGQYQERPLEERHQDAREQRAAWVTDHPDAMAEMHLFGAAVLIHGAFNRLTDMAKTDARAGVVAVPGTSFGAAATSGHSVGGAVSELAETEGDAGADDASLVHGNEDDDAARGDATDALVGDPSDVLPAAKDERTLAQRRVDIALDLLLTGAPAGHDTEDGLLAAITPHVSVTIPFLTLVDQNDLALTAAVTDNDVRGGQGGLHAEVDGRGPIDPHTARLVAGAASGWDRLLTHPVTGELLAVDRYRPSEHLRRHLRARDQRCRFPTCGMRATDSDLDHTRDAAFGGPTEADNLQALCRRHHVLKHHSPWHVRQFGGGLIEWTAPTGRVYVDKPPQQNTVTFRDLNENDTGETVKPSGPWQRLSRASDAPF